MSSNLYGDGVSKEAKIQCKGALFASLGTLWLSGTIGYLTEPLLSKFYGS